MNKSIVITACLIIALGIALGAIGAHALKSHLNSDQLLTFETGVRYQLFNGLGLLVYGSSLSHHLSGKKFFPFLNLTGMFLFSGMIYLYTLHVFYPSFKFLVHFVPIGGVLLITSWIILGISLLKSKSIKEN